MDWVSWMAVFSIGLCTGLVIDRLVRWVTKE